MRNMLACLSVALALFVGTSILTSQPAAAAAETKSAVELKLAMRKLWEEHITYTRNYIISALAELPDTDAVAKRLLENQDDIGAAIKPYYGDEAGSKLSSLLKDHITIATKVIKAAKEGNKEDLAAQQKAWDNNGKGIAEFLNGANPDNWPKGDLKDMLQKHLDLTTAEVTSRLSKNWESDINAYEKGHAHMLMFSDMLTDGIVKQFPTKFTQ